MSQAFTVNTINHNNYQNSRLIHSTVMTLRQHNNNDDDNNKLI